MKPGGDSNWVAAFARVLGPALVFLFLYSFRDGCHRPKPLPSFSKAYADIRQNENEAAARFEANNPKMAEALRREDIFALKTLEDQRLGAKSPFSLPPMQKGRFYGLMSEADSCLSRGDFVNALRLVREAIDQTVPRQTLAEIADHGDVSKAGINAWHLQGLAKLTKVYLRSGDYVGARSTFRRLMALLHGCDIVNRREWRMEAHMQVLDDRYPGKHLGRGLFPLIENWQALADLRNLVLSVGTESEMAEYLSKSAEFTDLAIYVAGVSDLQEDPKRAEAHRLAAEILIFNKGAILETLLERERLVAASENPTIKSAVELLWKARNQLASAEHRLLESTNREPDRETLAWLQQRREEAESKLDWLLVAMDVGQTLPPLGLSNIASVLPARSVLIDFIRIRPTGTFSAAPAEEAYAAVVIRPGSSPTVARVTNLGPAARVDAAIRAWRQSIEPREGILREEDVRFEGNRLADAVWKPVAGMLGDSTNIYICPDGELNFVPFAALPVPGDPSRFLLDAYNVSYVSSARELLRRAAVGQGQILVIGSPDFGLTSHVDYARQGKPPRSSPHPADSGGESLPPFFKPLPGFEQEVRAVATAFQKRGRTPSLVTGTNASKAALMKIKRPEVLHLATHGFFLSQIAPGFLAADERGVGGIRPSSGTRQGLRARACKFGGCRTMRCTGRASP